MIKQEFRNLVGYKLYRHTSPSGKVYIGITRTSVYARWNRGRGYRECKAFYNAILKYGWNNIKHEVLFTNLEGDKAKKLEIELVRHYKSLGISYNISDGGDLSSKSEYSRRKSSENMKRLWRTCPEKLIHKGIKKPPISIETIRKRSRAVIQFDIEGNYLSEYPSVSEASLSTGISNKSIIHCCTGGYFSKQRAKFINIRQAGGFIWKYKEDIL